MLPGPTPASQKQSPRRGQIRTDAQDWSLHRFVAETIGEMVVDHTDGLHKGVADRRAHEAKAAFLQSLAHGVRFRSFCRHSLASGPVGLFWPSPHKLPDIGVEAANLFLDSQEGAGVRDGGGDFQAVADDAGILQKLANFLGVVAGDALRLEVVEDFALARSFAEDRVPTETGLCTFQNEKFKQYAVIVNRHAALFVVIRDVPAVCGPRAAVHDGCFWLCGHGTYLSRISIFERVAPALQRPFKIDPGQLGGGIGNQKPEYRHQNAAYG